MSVTSEQVSSTYAGRTKTARVDQVILFRTADKLVSAMTEGGEIVLNESIASIERTLGADFVQVDRGTLVPVNRARLLCVDPDNRCGWVAVRGEDDPVRVSRRRIKSVCARLAG